MKITIIVPVHAFTMHENFIVFPEHGMTPAQQIKWVMDFDKFYKEGKLRSSETVVTGSPYIAEGLCKIEGAEIVFSDGEDVLTSEQFFYHFADPMRRIANNFKSIGSMEDNTINNTQTGGAFLESLKRNNKQIRDDRATAIGEDAEMVYKRKIEDLEMNIRRMKRNQENMLDLSPNNATNLQVAKDFNPVEYADNDIELGKQIRNAVIALNIAKRRYNYLFGHRYELEKLEE